MAQSSSPYLHNGSSSAIPPRYSTLSVATLPRYPNAGELDINPRAGHSTSLQSFEFCLENQSRDPWVTLRLSSKVPASLQRPRYTSGEDVRGSVILDLKRPQTVLSIVALLRGRIVTSSLAEGSHTFLEEVHPVWNSASGIAPPRPADLRPGKEPPLPPSASTSRSAVGKLQGQYEIAFSFPFPTTFQSSSLPPQRNSRNRETEGEDMSVCATPQTIMQRRINMNVIYEVVLKLTTGTLLNGKHRITANVLYVPAIKAPPLPPLRAGAYRCGTFLVGPQEDPSGWQALPSMNFYVSAKDGVRPINVECTVYVADPTIYCRGTVIPCFLVCRNTSPPDANASPSDRADASALLHAFTAQQCISLKLFQQIISFQGPQTYMIGMVQARKTTTKPSKSANKDAGMMAKDGGITIGEEFGNAVWWTPVSLQAGTETGREGTSNCPVPPPEEAVSCLEGEIHLDVGLLPSYNAPFLSALHVVSAFLNPSQELDIRPAGSLPRSQQGTESTIAMESNGELSSLPVTIVTIHGAGPPTTSFTPRPPAKKDDPSIMKDTLYLPYHGLF